MSIKYDKLLHFKIPDVVERFTKRDTAFYALSVGLGQDPLDRRHLRFVDEQKPMVALPSIVTVLGSPGFWLALAQSETGVDATRVVHGEQRIAIHAPLPVEGELLGRTRVTSVVDKGAGKSALLYSEKQLIDVRTGQTLATTASTTFLRGQGGFGGPAGPEKTPHVLPERPPDLSLASTTRPEQALYYRMNGDDNPLHADPDIAQQAGFPAPILHGLCTFGVVCHALIHLLGNCDPKALREMDLRFSQPVFPGETIRTDVWSDGSFQARVVERDVVVVSNGKTTIGVE